MSADKRSAMLAAVRREFGSAANELPDISGMSDEALETLHRVLISASDRQKQLLKDAADHSLRLVPRLLRPVIRKIMFGRS